MTSRKSLNCIFSVLVIASLVIGLSGQVYAQTAPSGGGGQASAPNAPPPPSGNGLPSLAGPQVNDDFGPGPGTTQMRSTTQAMRQAAASHQVQPKKGVTLNFAGLNAATKSLSPLAGTATELATMAPALSQPDYFGVANWANSPLPQLDTTGAVIPGTGMRKFVDTLPGLCGVSAPNDLGQCIPLGQPDKTTFPGSDYYEIAVVEYREQMHADLPATGTELRGYVQIVPSTFPGAVALTTANGLTQNIVDGQGNQVYGATKPHYLGPTILAQGCSEQANPTTCTPRPVRVKFTNYLPTGPAGDLFIPVDTTYMGAGMGPGGSIYEINVTNGGAGYTSAPTVAFAGGAGTGAAATATVINGKVVSILVTNGGSGYTAAPTVSFSGGGGTGAAATAVLAGQPGEMYTENRATLHLHGGNTPWISDGTPHQWTAPQGELTSYSKGDSVAYVPDMWFDANGRLITSCAGQTTCAVAGASNDPGLGSLTFFWTNQQSGRLLFYHDHSYGITRLNVYAGEAAGYLIVDPTEENALAAAGLPGTVGTTPDLAHLIPLVIQDKTFVPDSGVVGGQLAATDPTWDTVKYGGKGNLWFGHVYTPNQNPSDVTGANAYGRWDYGPWFWPPQDPSTFVPGGQPYACTSSFYNPPNPPVAFPPLMCPGTPNPSGTPEGFMDTPVLNGTAYPSLTVDPTAYRFQMLMAGNDRTWNLGLYMADPLEVAVTNGGTGYTSAPTVSFVGGGGSGAIAAARMSNGSVTSILITGVGHGYTIAPNVTIIGNGIGATAKAVVDLATTTILAINITSGGSGYTSASVVIDAPLGCTTGCTTATATATVTPPGSILAVDVLNPGSGWASNPTVVFTGGGGTGAAAIASINSEVKMVPAEPATEFTDLPPCTQVNPTGGAMQVMALLDANGQPLNGTGLQAGCWPATWPTDGRDGGVPDPTTAGPPFIQIGSESGLLPSPVIIPSTPVGYEYNRRSITVLNVFYHGLLLGPAERADVVVDFSQFAGKTLILYNDSPAPVPAFDPRTDYYTGDPDQTSSGGAPTTLPGYGPNTRTIMQIKVRATAAGGSGSLSSVTLTNGGSGYTAPSVAITGGGGTGAAATATGKVSAVVLTNAGTGYTNPVISFSGGGGSGASAVFASGALSGLTLTANGSGYTSMPVVSFTGGGGTLASAIATGSVSTVTLTASGAGYATTAVSFTGGGGAGATITATGVVNAIAVTNGGAGYSVMPTVTLSGGGGTGATASATGAVDAVAVANGGAGYSVMPTVTLSGGGGTGATATATGAVNAVAVTNGGGGYAAMPTVSFTGGGGAGAIAAATGAVDHITVTVPGAWYHVPAVGLTGGGGAGATAVAVGSVDHITVTVAGSGYVTPVVTIAAPACTPGPSCVTALAHATKDVTGTITGILIDNPGLGYTFAPTITIADTPPGAGTGALAVATMSITGINVTAGGSGYTSAPAVTITDSGTPLTPAAATATLMVTAVTVTAGGSGYASAPAVVFSAGAAAGTATLAVNAITVTAGGSGYTSAPTVVILGGATATATLKVIAIAVTAGGSGYKAAPTVAFSSGTAAATATLSISTLTLLLPGAGYSTAPAVSFTGGGAGATAAVTLKVTGLTITSPGSGYTSAPTVVFTGGGGAGAAATATIVSTGILLTNGGSGYTSAPTVVITDSGGVGSGATAVATLSLTGVTLTSPGSGYTSVPAVTITDSGVGIGAAAVANMAGAAQLNLATLQTGVSSTFVARQNQMIVKEPGFPVGNGNAALPTYLRIQDTSLPGWIGGAVQGITLTNGGLGYSSAPTVTFVGGGGAGATAALTFVGANVNGLTLTSGGSGYISNPTVSLTGGGGTGATATAQFTRIVNSVTMVRGGSGYTSAPTVTFVGGLGAGGVAATGTAVVSGGRVTGVIITSGGFGYTQAPNVRFTGGGGSGASATATITGVVYALLLTNGGSGYTSAPTVNFTGGLGTGGVAATATATYLPGTVASLVLTNGGNGYTSAPSIVFSGGGTPTTPASATVSVPVNPLLPKAIQELFTLDYGRMNATLGVELPFTNFFIQTTIPYGYIDPPTEMFKSGDIQLWKITHNGVDTHFIHFHLYDVQVINRVGWDGMIKPPDANEMAWKDTVRMNPLEDIIVALRPMKQNLPWELPNSVRPMDVTQPIGANNPNNAPGFANIDPSNQPAVVNNDVINYGWEYVVHCHILGHEENDMMRAQLLAVPPDPPTGVTATRFGIGNAQSVVVTWVDQSINETGFTVQRATNLNGPWLDLTPSAPAAPGTGTAMSYTDTTMARRTTYYYRVVANNLVGYTQQFAAPVVGWPTLSADSVPVYAPASITILSLNQEGPIFADSFETGLGEWSGIVGSADVITRAVVGPYGGKLGMAASLSQPNYVYDSTPAGETMYDASFAFNPNKATADNPVDIFVGLDQDGQLLFGVQYQSVSTDTFQLRGWMMQNGEQVFTPWDVFTPPPVEPGEDPEHNPSLTHKIEVAYLSDAKGGLTLYIDDAFFATLAGDTSASQVDEALLGPSLGTNASLQGMSLNASGRVYFDEFTSSRLNGVQFFNIYLPLISK